jgi:hypothetical protein
MNCRASFFRLATSILPEISNLKRLGAKRASGKKSAFSENSTRLVFVFHSIAAV